MRSSLPNCLEARACEEALLVGGDWELLEKELCKSDRSDSLKSNDELLPDPLSIDRDDASSRERRDVSMLEVLD